MDDIWVYHMSMNFDLSLFLIFGLKESIDFMVLGSSQTLNWSTDFRIWCTVENHEFLLDCESFMLASNVSVTIGLSFNLL